MPLDQAKDEIHNTLQSQRMQDSMQSIATSVKTDLNQAYFWSILAEAGGDQASKYRASILASRLTRAEVVAAQQQANDWLKQHQKPFSAR